MATPGRGASNNVNTHNQPIKWNQIVWAPSVGYPMWPAIVLNRNEWDRLPPCKDDELILYWIKWNKNAIFGVTKETKCMDFICGFEKNADRLLLKKIGKGLHKRAVNAIVSCLQVLNDVHGEEIVNLKGNTKGDHETWIKAIKERNYDLAKTPIILTNEMWSRYIENIKMTMVVPSTTIDREDSLEREIEEATSKSSKPSSSSSSSDVRCLTTSTKPSSSSKSKYAAASTKSAAAPGNSTSSKVSAKISSSSKNSSNSKKTSTSKMKSSSTPKLTLKPSASSSSISAKKRKALSGAAPSSSIDSNHSKPSSSVSSKKAKKNGTPSDDDEDDDDDDDDEDNNEDVLLSIRRNVSPPEEDEMEGSLSCTSTSSGSSVTGGVGGADKRQAVDDAIDNSFGFGDPPPASSTNQKGSSSKNTLAGDGPSDEETKTSSKSNKKQKHKIQIHSNVDTNLEGEDGDSFVDSKSLTDEEGDNNVAGVRNGATVGKLSAVVVHQIEGGGEEPGSIEDESFKFIEMIAREG